MPFTNKEYPIIFRSGPYHLYGHFFEYGSLSSPWVIMIHPFAEEKKSSQRMLVETARRLCKNGISVFLFDLCGCGDSEGNFMDITVSEWINDIKNAIAFVRREKPTLSLGLLGIRFGGYMVMKTAENDKNIQYIIAIEPVLDPVFYFKRILRRKLIKELHTDGQVVSNRDNLLNKLKITKLIDFEGYPISHSFYSEFIRWKPIHNKSFDCDLALFQVSLKSKVFTDYLKIKNSDHEKGEIIVENVNLAPFWERIEQIDCSPLIDKVSQYCINQNTAILQK